MSSRKHPPTANLHNRLVSDNSRICVTPRTSVVNGAERDAFGAFVGRGNIVRPVEKDEGCQRNSIQCN